MWRNRGISGAARGAVLSLAVAAAFAVPKNSVRPAAVAAGRPGPARTDTLPRHIRAALSLYRGRPDVARIRRELDRWDRSGGPTTVDDSIAAAALWRRAGQEHAALAALPAATDPDGRIRPRVELGRARILLGAPASAPAAVGPASRRIDDGAAAFWRACETLDGLTRRALWEDLRGLATPDEQTEWVGLPDDASACPWVRRFVDERAFRMAVRPAERLRIHYVRLREARRRYYIRTPRLTRDMTDRLGRADSLEIDDRGLILLRMGEPLATVAPFMGLNETWVYYRPGAPRIFHFAPVSRTGLRALGDYRMLESLAFASGFTMRSELMGMGGRRLAHLYQSRRGLDFLFEDALFRSMDRRMRAAGDRFNPGFQGFLAWEQERNETDARYAVSGIPDAPELAPALEFAYETLRFREPGGDRMEVWFLGATRVGDLTARSLDADTSAGGAGGVEYRVGADLALLAPGGLRMLAEEERPRTPRPLRSEDGVPVRLRASLEPGIYPFTLTLRDRGSERDDLGNWAQDTVTVFGPLAGLPAVSDIAVAADSGGAWSRDGETYLSPGPTHVVRSDGTAHVYFEVYGVRAGDRYEVEVRVVADSAANRIFAVGAGDAAFTVRFASEAGRDRAGGGVGRHHLRVELGESPPGAYLLAVRVSDARTGIHSLPAVTPLYRPAGRGDHWIEAPRRRSTIVNP